jgi:hypothetical protein
MLIHSKLRTGRLLTGEHANKWLYQDTYLVFDQGTGHKYKLKIVPLPTKAIENHKLDQRYACHINNGPAELFHCPEWDSITLGNR